MVKNISSPSKTTLWENMKIATWNIRSVNQEKSEIINEHRRRE
jgi:hypothetical protein